jgi:hypothetical protein
MPDSYFFNKLIAFATIGYEQRLFLDSSVGSLIIPLAARRCLVCRKASLCYKRTGEKHPVLLAYKDIRAA